jgi:hypothetical protein
MPLEQSRDCELNYSSKSLDSRNEFGELGQGLGDSWSDRHTFLDLSLIYGKVQFQRFILLIHPTDSPD